MDLVKEIIKGLLPEQEKRTVAVYAGGFKPPTTGHFEVVKTALDKYPNIDEFIILIGGKERDGVSPEESIIIWDIYKQYLGIKVTVELSSKPPIQALYNYAKNHPDENVLFVIGAREGNEDDFKDIASRTKSVDNYPNLKVSTVVTQGGASGTAARNAAKISVEKLKPLLPNMLKDEEVEEIFDILSNVVKEQILTEVLDPKTFDFKPMIKSLTTSMEGDGLKLKPYPKVKFIHNAESNSEDFFGKTAYYDPNNNEVVLYTLGRHPKDILRSYAHELIHVHQNHEDRLEGINTDNVNEDDYLEKIEREAYETGNIMFRGWTNKITEDTTNSIRNQVPKPKIECGNCDWSWNVADGGDDLYDCHKCGYDNTPSLPDSFGLNAYARGLVDEIRNQFNTNLGVVKQKTQVDGLTPDEDGWTVNKLKEETNDYKVYCDMDGVLTDFELGYEKLTGIDLKGEFQKGDGFWDPISKAGVGFWAGLQWMPGGKELWAYLKPFNPVLLSAPSREESSRIGKAVWVKHKIPGTKLILRYAKQKQQLATPNSILIDDRQVNIDQWEAAGGIGILHTSTANTIEQLKQLGL